MNIDNITQSIAYCGRVCYFCQLSETCVGCRGQLEEDGGSKADCYPYKCGTEKGLDGCWECPSFPCETDMFHSEHGVRLRAFVTFLKIFDNKEKLAYHLLRNQQNGIKYVEYGKSDYDDLVSEDDVIALLLFGRLKKVLKEVSGKNG